jgi:predicted dehydrogenase
MKAAIAAGKHVLVDKPFADQASVSRMVKAAAAKGVAFMDATHFVHHPRAAAIRAATAGEDRLAPIPPHSFLLPILGS